MREADESWNPLRGSHRLILELLHAAGWHIDEAFVEQFAHDAARALGRGYGNGHV